MEDAAAIPGSVSFVELILSTNGKIALITNRDREMDDYTWSNLKQLGFPITRENTCILGRNEADRNSVGEIGIINDKDLRRNQVLSGEATYCWDAHPQAKEAWSQPLSLVMQVGDNIKDFYQTTQQSVDLDAFLKRQGKDILILPNAMYGSWD